MATTGNAPDDRSPVSDKTVVITGASSGIGEAAARALKGRAAHVVIVGRSPGRTEQVARELDAPFYLADFRRLDDVRNLAANLAADLPRIDVLANNAGGIMGPQQLTVDGNEWTLQVNHLAPFLLTNLLLDVLIASRGVVIATSSIANRRAGALDLRDLNLEGGYNPELAYSKTKLMNILFSRELHRRYHAKGISSVAFEPGIVRTRFASEFSGRWSFAYTSALRHLLRSPARGAATLVWLASSRPDRAWTSGEFYKGRSVSRASPKAYDGDLASGLWDLSSELTSLS